MDREKYRRRGDDVPLTIWTDLSKKIGNRYPLRMLAQEEDECHPNPHPQMRGEKIRSDGNKVRFVRKTMSDEWCGTYRGGKNRMGNPLTKSPDAGVC